MQRETITSCARCGLAVVGSHRLRRHLCGQHRYGGHALSDAQADAVILHSASPSYPTPCKPPPIEKRTCNARAEWRTVNYDDHNREERAACTHLFRLLHEGLATTPESSGLAHVLDLLRDRLDFGGPAPDLSAAGAVLHTEVSLIRDAYAARKPDVGSFMDALVALVGEQEDIAGCRPYTALPKLLSDPRLTHPNQIARKGRLLGLLSRAELRIYGAVQAMFNAKPDLAIVCRAGLIVFEAKLTKPFDEVQLRRTRTIVEVWARLLHADLGFGSPPPFAIARLGSAADHAHLTWQAISEVARTRYPETDRTRICLEAIVRLLEELPWC